MKYIVAVSGGVDSVALLHMLHTRSPHELIVAHVDHGIRSESSRDAAFVEQLARQLGLPFVSTSLSLGPDVSEAAARHARYEWLESVRAEHDAHAIATAHHQDDVLETVVLNLMRGTGWRGLASLRNTSERFRPLLDVSKAALTNYAIDNQLLWREDRTNYDTKYTRNYIRHVFLPKMSPGERKQLMVLAHRQQQLRTHIEHEVTELRSQITSGLGLSRHQLIMTPDPVAFELLRHATDGSEPLQLRRLLHFARTGRQGAVMQLGGGKTALLTRRQLVI